MPFLLLLLRAAAQLRRCTINSIKCIWKKLCQFKRKLLSLTITKRFTNLLFKLFEYSVRLSFHLRTSAGYELYFILIYYSVHSYTNQFEAKLRLAKKVFTIFLKYQQFPNPQQHIETKPLLEESSSKLVWLQTGTPMPCYPQSGVAGTGPSILDSKSSDNKVTCNEFANHGLCADLSKY